MSAGAQVSYSDLYARWERANWRATEIDFTEDRRQWHAVVTEHERRAALWNYAMFFHGEDAVTDDLAQFIAAAPLEEQKYFLATQQVDEARHAIFFKRFMHEVVGDGAMLRAGFLGPGQRRAATRPGGDGAAVLLRRARRRPAHGTARPVHRAVGVRGRRAVARARRQRLRRAAAGRAEHVDVELRCRYEDWVDLVAGRPTRAAPWSAGACARTARRARCGPRAGCSDLGYQARAGPWGRSRSEAATRSRWLYGRSGERGSRRGGSSSWTSANV